MLCIVHSYVVCIGAFAGGHEVLQTQTNTILWCGLCDQTLFLPWGKKTQWMTGSTDSSLRREIVLLINMLNVYKWFSSMEDEDHHFPQDMKSCWGCHILTSYTTWSTWDSFGKNKNKNKKPKRNRHQSSLRIHGFDNISALMIGHSMARMEKHRICNITWTLTWVFK